MDSLGNTRRAALAALCQQIGATLLDAFGSRAREALAWIDDGPPLTSGPSALDIGPRVAPGVHWTAAEKVRMAQALEALFGVDRVDLVVLNEADPFLAAKIIRGERPNAADTRDADEYDLYVLRRGGDLAPLEHERLALIFQVKE